MVTTEDGLKPIQSVCCSERVWGYDLVAGEWKLRRVVETYEHDYDGDLVTIAVEGEVIEATSNHPCWVVEGKGLEERGRTEHTPEAPPDNQTQGCWVEADNLRVGDVLLLKTGRHATIIRLSVQQVRQKVYNFQVEEVHTYSVGRSQVLVHNKPLKNPTPPPESGKPLHIDIGGEGRNVDAVNVNPSEFTSTTVAPGRRIPNRVEARGENLPFGDKSVDIISIENAPIRPGTITEIQRVLKPGGEIRLVGPNAPEVVSAFQKLADAVGGKVYKVIVPAKNDVGGTVYFNIILPK